MSTSPVNALIKKIDSQKYTPNPISAIARVTVDFIPNKNNYDIDDTDDVIISECLKQSIRREIKERTYLPVLFTDGDGIKREMTIKYDSIDNNCEYLYTCHQAYGHIKSGIMRILVDDMNVRLNRDLLQNGRVCGEDAIDVFNSICVNVLISSPAVYAEIHRQ